MCIAADAADIHALQRCAARNERFVLWQDKLRVCDQLSARLGAGGEPIYQVARRREHFLAREQILHLWPVDHHMLLGGYDDIIL